VVLSVNGQGIDTLDDYSRAIKSVFSDGLEKRVDIRTDTRTYTLFTDEAPEITVMER